jgi:hypothetical protein
MQKSIIVLLLLSACAATPTAVVLKDHSCTLREEPTQVLQPLGVIQFDANSDRLDYRARNALTRVASELRQQPDATVRLEGDLRRARAAKQFLVASGVTHCRLDVVSDRANDRPRPALSTALGTGPASPIQRSQR